MRELRCNGCRRLLGTTTRTQAVPVQCTDPFCALSPPSSQNEERDSFIEHLAIVEQRPLVQLGESYSMTRQGVARILANR